MNKLIILMLKYPTAIKSITIASNCEFPEVLLY